MAIKKLGEAVEAAVANTISANINAEIDTIWSAWSDGIPKVYPANVYAGPRMIIPEYPSIEVSSMRGRMPQNAAPYWGRIEHDIDITAVFQSDDYHILDKMCKRYLVAIWEVLMKNQQLDLSLSGLSGIDPIEYGRSGVIKESKTSLLMEAVGWSCIVHVDESV